MRTPSGGSWGETDAGTYTIAINVNQVFDTAVTGANAVPAQTVGTFEVLAVSEEIFSDGFEAP